MSSERLRAPQTARSVIGARTFTDRSSASQLSTLNPLKATLRPSACFKSTQRS